MKKQLKKHQQSYQQPSAEMDEKLHTEHHHPTLPHDYYTSTQIPVHPEFPSSSPPSSSTLTSYGKAFIFSLKCFYLLIL